MKLSPLNATGFVLAAAIAGLTVMAPAAPAAKVVTTSSPGNVMGLRVQWIDLAGNHPHTDCTIHIVNKSLTEEITIRQFLFLGPGGRNDVIGAGLDALNRTIAPLEEYRFRVNSTFVTHLTPQTSTGGYGVRNLVMAWDGPRDALYLEAVHERYATGQTDQRTHWTTAGYFAEN